jgi:hypothetical protein
MEHGRGGEERHGWVEGVAHVQPWMNVGASLSHNDVPSLNRCTFVLLDPKPPPRSFSAVVR